MLRRFFAWLRGGPSASERMLQIASDQSAALLDLLREQSAARERSESATFGAIKELLEASKAQTGSFESYLKLVTTSAQPVVRVMTDQDEAVREALQRLKAKHGQTRPEGLEDLGIQMNELAQPRDFQAIFADLKREIPGA